jgi:hypothetical protein
LARGYLARDKVYDFVAARHLEEHRHVVQRIAGLADGVQYLLGVKPSCVLGEQRWAAYYLIFRSSLRAVALQDRLYAVLKGLCTLRGQIYSDGRLGFKLGYFARLDGLH